jgi:hypothetical protein
MEVEKESRGGSRESEVPCNIYFLNSQCVNIKMFRLCWPVSGFQETLGKHVNMAKSHPQWVPAGYETNNPFYQFHYSSYTLTFIYQGNTLQMKGFPSCTGLLLCHFEHGRREESQSRLSSFYYGWNFTETWKRDTF